MNDDELRRLAQAFNEVFFIPSSGNLLDSIRLRLQSVSQADMQAGSAFCVSVESIIQAAGLPYTLGAAGTHQRRTEVLYYAERLTALVKNPPVERAAAAADARERVKERTGSPEYGDEINAATCRFLLDLSNQPKVHDAVRHLHAQSTVLIWGAFESAVRDLFRNYMNRTPASYAKLLQHADAKRRFDLPRTSIDKIAELGFDLSRKLGNLLLEHNDFTDLATIRATYDALFPSDATLRASLQSQDLWRLFQRRNLIVHRQGIIDSRYLSATGDAQVLGSKLVVRPADLVRSLRLIVTAVDCMLQAVRVDTPKE